MGGVNSLCGHLQLVDDEGEVGGGSALHIEVEVVARVVPTHQGVLAIGPHIEHVEDAVTKQRRLDAKLVKIKSQLEWIILLLLHEPHYPPLT